MQLFYYGDSIMKMTGAKMVVECLIQEGVDVVFGYPGGAIMHVYDKWNL